MPSRDEEFSAFVRASYPRLVRTAYLPSGWPPDSGELGVVNRSALLPALRALPKGQRTAVVLRYVEDLTEAQTAQAMGVSIGTVKSQTSRALAALRVTLGSDLNEATTLEQGGER